MMTTSSSPRPRDLGVSTAHVSTSDHRDALFPSDEVKHDEPQISRDNPKGSSSTPPSHYHHAPSNQPYNADPTPEAETVTWNGPEDRQDPFNWPPRKKWRAVGLGLAASFVCSMNGSILAVAHAAISADFRLPDASSFPHAYWLTTTWGVGAALFPLLLFPALEDWGVRPVVLGTYFYFVCLLVPVGFAHNFATLVVVRLFSGGCVPIMSDAVASIASNVFHGDRARSVPIALYVLVYLGATSLGPVVGSAVLQRFGSWRWIGHVEVIVTGALFPPILPWSPRDPRRGHPAGQGEEDAQRGK
ncbi:Major facilitator superfamily domain- general substrate transporter [Apiospora marii]|uniref:Major facilitator superfamily domain- general substrate transporter n=1 Tax=Apiospora marii TaxID=335849 RepID=UPI00312E14B6